MNGNMGESVDSPYDIRNIMASCEDDSNRWFPQTTSNIQLQYIALVGEVGEFGNMMKKVLRGSLPEPAKDDDVYMDMCNELVDVLIYLVNLANIFGMDLAKMYWLKREFNEGRFGAHSSDSPHLAVVEDGKPE